MASASDIRAGRAAVELGTNDGPLQKGLDMAKRRLANFGNALAGLGSALALGFVTNKISGWVESFAQGGRELYTMSRTTGIAVGELAELKSAVGSLGGDFDGTITSVRKMDEFLGNMQLKGEQTNETMRALGLTMADLQGLSRLDRFQLIGERVAGIQNESVRAAVARQVLGRQGAATAGLMPQLGAAREHARDSGLPTEEETRRAYDLSLAMEKLDKVVKGVYRAIGSALAPAFQAAYSHLIPLVKSVRDWVRGNEDTIQKVGAVIGMIAGVSAAFLGLSAVVKIATMAIGGPLAILGGLKAVFLSLWAIVGLFLTPWGLFVAGATTAAVVVGRMTGVFDGAQRSLGRLLGALRNTASIAWGGIADAISAGNLELAAEIAILGIKTAFLDFKVWFEETFGMTFNDAFAGIQNGFADTASGIRSTWSAVSDFLVQSVTGWVIAFLHIGEVLGLIDSQSARMTRQQLLLEGMNRDVDASAESGGIPETKRKPSDGSRGAGGPIAPGDARRERIEKNRVAANNSDRLGEVRDQLAEARLRAQKLKDLAAEQRANALNTAAAGIGDHGDLGGGTSGRATFSRDALFGFGGNAPVDRIVAAQRDTSQKVADMTTLVVQSIEQAWGRVS